MSRRISRSAVFASCRRLPAASAAVLAAVCLLACGVADGQPPDDPFADFPRPGTPDEEPADEPGAEEEDAAAAEAVPDEITDPDDPVLAAIREANPTTPIELVRAARTLTKYGAPTEARKYLRKLIDSDPAASDLVELFEEFGSATFLRMRRNERLGEEGQRVARAVTEAAYRWYRDPRRIEPLIEELQAPDRDVRVAAVVDLTRAGSGAVGPLVDVLADRDRADEHRMARIALAALGKDAVGPLIATLDTEDDMLRAEVIRALGRTGSRRAVQYLIHPYLSKESPPDVRQAARRALIDIVGHAPSPREGEYYLLEETNRRLSGVPPETPDDQGRVELWQWDAAAQEPVRLELPARDAALAVAADAAADLFALHPDSLDYRRLYAVANLESEKVQAGLDEPLPGGAGSARVEVAELGAEAVSDVLKHAMDIGRTGGAIGAAEVLSDLGDESILRQETGSPAPLAEALHHPDRRLRLAAADAVLRIAPENAFPGASRVTDVLGYLAATRGERRVLVAHPRLGEARSIAGMLVELGFHAETVSTGKELIRRAVASPGWEVVLLSEEIAQPEIDATLQALRRDPRTALLPVGLMARTENIPAWDLRFEGEPLTVPHPVPLATEDLHFHLRRLLRAPGRRFVPREERIAQAGAALDWLLEVARNRGQFGYLDVESEESRIESALYVPELTERAAELLGWIATPSAQTALVELASQSSRSVEQRQAALAGFEAAVERRGTLLTTEQIERQYDRYNQSEFAGEATQNVLAGILDVMEAAAEGDGQAELPTQP